VTVKNAVRPLGQLDCGRGNNVTKCLKNHAAKNPFLSGHKIRSTEYVVRNSATRVRKLGSCFQRASVRRLIPQMVAISRSDLVLSAMSKAALCCFPLGTTRLVGTAIGRCTPSDPAEPCNFGVGQFVLGCKNGSSGLDFLAIWHPSVHTLSQASHSQKSNVACLSDPMANCRLRPKSAPQAALFEFCLEGPHARAGPP
jgi:hypothetical protein